MSDLLVVSSYPERASTHSHKTVGGASYTKQLLLGLLEQAPAKKITVAAESFDQPETYTEQDIVVDRNWQRGNVFSILKLCWTLATTTSPQLLLSFEAYMFGSALFAFPVFVALAIARLRGITTRTLLHQVPASLSAYVKNPLLRSVLELSKSFLFWLISLANTEVIVFEEQLKQQFGYQHKTIVLPHLVPTVPKITQAQARKKLNLPAHDKICLYLGYLAPYKGVDWLVEHWPQQTEFKLIVGGGINPNHRGNQAVEQLVSDIETTAKQKNIPVTGFIPEELLHDYLAAADVVILPYTTFMSSSGPLSLAVAHQKPVLLSDQLAVYAQSEDFKQALAANDLTASDITFSFTTESLSNKLQTIATSDTQFKGFATALKQARSLPTISQTLKNVLHW